MLKAKVTMRNPEEQSAFGTTAYERPVPRISIHAFCEFPDTGAALQRASSDRRLSKAQATVQLGGVRAAIDYYAGQVTPNLLIVETRLSGGAALEELDRLAEVCDPTTKVVVVGRINDVELYRELMRRGASEYLVAPLDPLHLIEVISGLYTSPESKPIGRVIAFIGARGGTGASTIAHNIGWCIAEEQRIGTAIVDFDLPFGTLGLDYNDDPGQGVLDALSAPERLDDVLLDRLLVKHGECLSLFTAPALLDRDTVGGVEAYDAVLDAVRRVMPCVIADVPHTWEPWAKAMLIGADEIVIVATPDLASLRNTKNMIEILRQNRPNDAPPKLALNQIGVARRPEIPVKDFAETVGFAPSLVLPFDPAAFGVASNNGQMLAEMNQKSPALSGIRSLAQILTGRKPAERKTTPPLFSFLKNKKRA
jgi:pilus assembly protein CpaE